MKYFFTLLALCTLVVGAGNPALAQKKKPAAKAKPTAPAEIIHAALMVQAVMPELGDHKELMGSDEQSIMPACMEAMRYLTQSVICDHAPIPFPFIKPSKVKRPLTHLSDAIDALEASKKLYADKSKTFCGQRDDALRTISAAEQWLKNVRSAMPGK